MRSPVIVISLSGFILVGSRWLFRFNLKVFSFENLRIASALCDVTKIWLSFLKKRRSEFTKFPNKFWKQLGQEKLNFQFPNSFSFNSCAGGLSHNQIPNRAFLKSRPSITPLYVPFLMI